VTERYINLILPLPLMIKRGKPDIASITKYTVYLQSDGVDTTDASCARQKVAFIIK